MVRLWSAWYHTPFTLADYNESHFAWEGGRKPGDITAGTGIFKSFSRKMRKFHLFLKQIHFLSILGPLDNLKKCSFWHVSLLVYFCCRVRGIRQESDRAQEQVSQTPSAGNGSQQIGQIPLHSGNTEGYLTNLWTYVLSKSLTSMLTFISVKYENSWKNHVFVSNAEKNQLKLVSIAIIWNSIKLTNFFYEMTQVLVIQCMI